MHGMVERVAAAIQAARQNYVWLPSERLARIVIEAMREPTKEQLLAAHEVLLDKWVEGVPSKWQRYTSHTKAQGLVYPTGGAK